MTTPYPRPRRFIRRTFPFILARRLLSLRQATAIASAERSLRVTKYSLGSLSLTSGFTKEQHYGPKFSIDRLNSHHPCTLAIRPQRFRSRRVLQISLRSNRGLSPRRRRRRGGKTLHRRRGVLAQRRIPRARQLQPSVSRRRDRSPHPDRRRSRRRLRAGPQRRSIRGPSSQRRTRLAYRPR